MKLNGGPVGLIHPAAMRTQLPFCVLTAALCACQPKPLSSNSPWVEAEPLALDFGPIPVGLTVTLPVVLKNTGRYELVVDPAQSDLSMFTGPTTALHLDVGERRAVDIGFTPAEVGVHTSVVHLRSNAANDPDLGLAVTGQGTPRLVCAACDSPPADSCASAGTLITWEPHGTCVMNKCEYQAATIYCGGACVAPPAHCTALDGGAVHAGKDAGVADGSVEDAGKVDAGIDAGPAVDGGGIFTEPGSWSFVVPAGIHSVTVKAWGGGGGGGNQTTAFGGAGAFVRATLVVTPGEVLEVQVAEGGLQPGNGAGASAVLRGPVPLVIAAGGGGGGSDGCSGCTAGANGHGGAGGASQGQNGAEFGAAIAPFCTGATGGGGATATQGGAGGTSTGSASSKCPGQPGTTLTGGRASGVVNACDTSPGATGWHQGGGQGNGGGGAGGAGRFGGGGAGFIWTYCAGGGGGGSSFASPVATQLSMQAGVDQVPGNFRESAGAGSGGNRNADGKPGRVELSI